jgi:hypothetical protein
VLVGRYGATLASYMVTPMGRVSIREQWLIVGAGAVLCPAFVLLTVCVLGWLRFRRLWPAWRHRPGLPMRPVSQLLEGRPGAEPLVGEYGAAGTFDLSLTKAISSSRSAPTALPGFLKAYPRGSSRLTFDIRNSKQSKGSC